MSAAGPSHPRDGRAAPLLIAEIVLVLHALTYSTALHRTAAALTAVAGLLLASRVGCRRESLPLFVPLALGAVLSLASGAAPGPTIEMIGMLLGAWGWFLAGSAPAPEARAGGVRVGMIAAAVSFMMAAAAIAHFLLAWTPPRFWMVSTIDYAVATLLLGLLGRRALAGRRAVLLYLLVILGGVAASTSRALLIASVAVLLIDRRVLSRRGVLLGLLLLLLLLPFAWRRVASDALAWNRVRIYAAATNLILERPLTGWGFGAFDSVSPRAALPDPLEVRGMRRAVHAHSEPLELLVELGLPLGVAVLAATLLLGGALVRRAPVHAAAPFVATCVIGLFYFPLRLVFPLYISLFAAGGLLPDRPGRFRFLPALCALPILLYALGIMMDDPRLARWNARLAIEAAEGDEGVSRMLALEPERPESHANLGMLAARRGASGGAVLGFAAAAGRAPGEHSLRFELARACLWHARQVDDPAEARRFHEIGRRHLRTLRVLEPLSLAGHDAAGDTLGFLLADLRLAQLERRGEPERHIRLLRRRVDPELLEAPR